MYRIVARIRANEVSTAIQARNDFKEVVKALSLSAVTITINPADHNFWLPTPVIEIGSHKGYLIFASTTTFTLDESISIFRELMTEMFIKGYEECIEGECFEGCSSLPYRYINDTDQVMDIHDLAFGFGAIQETRVLQ